MDTSIKVSYEYSDNAFKVSRWLEELPELFAADFEVASRFTAKEKEHLRIRLETMKNLSFEERRVLQQQIESDGLSHPSLTVITHLSVGWSDRDSKVIVCSNNKIRDIVYDFLINTDKTQIWHNATFDFKHILYRTGYIPKNYIDTMLLARCILNDANGFKNNVGLKELMAYAYGDWAISRDNFTLEEMWDENMIRYAATDSPAIYKLYQDILEDQNKWKI